MSQPMDLVVYDGERAREMEEEENEEEENTLPRVMDILNFKVVPREPADAGYKSASFLPPENVMYAAEYRRLYAENEKLKKKLQSRESSKEERPSTPPSPDNAELEQLRIDKEELEMDLLRAEQCLSEEKRKVNDLQEMRNEYQTQLNECERKNEQWKEKLERANTELTAKVEEGRDTVSRLEKSNAELEKQKQELETVLEKTKEIEKLRALVSSLEQELANVKEMGKDFEARLQNEQQITTDVRMHLQNSEDTASSLQIQLERQVTKSSEYRAERDQTVEQVEKKEAQLREAEGIIVEQQKVVLDAREQKKRLEKILQINLKLDGKVLHLEGGIRERQQEIERLQRLLATEQDEHGRTRVNLRRLREFLFTCNQQLGTVLGNGGSSEAASSQDEGSQGTVEDALAALEEHVGERVTEMEVMQITTRQELGETQKLVMDLGQLIDSLPAATSTSSAHSDIGPTHLEMSTISSITTVIINTTQNVEQVNSSSSEETAPGPWPSNPAPAGKEKAASSCLYPPGIARHGRNKAGKDQGYFCFCSDKKFASERMLTAHINYFVGKFKFKCPVCALRFRTMATLKYHLRKIHGGILKPFKRACRQCGKEFNSGEKLLRHKRTVHDIQMSRRTLQKLSRSTETPSTPATPPAETPSKTDTEISISDEETGSPPAPSTRLDDTQILLPEWQTFPNEESQENDPFSSNFVSNQDGLQQNGVEANDSGTVVNTAQGSAPLMLSNIKIERPSSPSEPVQNDGPAAQKHGINWSRDVRRRGHFCVCGHQAGSIQALRKHVSYYAAKKIFVCTVCDRGFIEMAYLRSHLLTAHQIVSHRKGCRVCGMTFDTASELQKHQEKEQGCQRKKAMRRKIDQVDLTFEEAESPEPQRQPEEEKHAIDEERTREGFYCTCGIEAASKEILIKHIASLSGNKKFECNICKERFRILKLLHVHLVRDHNAKSTQLNKNLCGCRDCGNVFLSKTDLADHWKRHHQSNTDHSDPEGAAASPSVSEDSPTSEQAVDPEPLPPLPEDFPFAGDNMCLSESSPESPPPPVLVNMSHIKTEPRDGSELDAAAPTLQREHGVDRTKKSRGAYLCWCGHSASNENNLHRHIVYYTGESHFQCPQCPKRFQYTSYLRHHMIKVHNTDFTLKGCQRCGAMFDSGSELHAHQVEAGHRRERKVITEVDLTNLYAASPTPGPSRNVSTRSSKRKATVSESTTGSLVWSKKTHGVDKSKRNLGHFCLCGAKMSCSTNLWAHVNYFTSDKNFKCELCPQRFHLSSRLKAHMTMKHKNKRVPPFDNMGFGCKECGIWGFPTREQLLEHLRSVHPSRASQVEPPSRPTVIRGPSIIIATRGSTLSPPGPPAPPPPPPLQQPISIGGSNTAWGVPHGIDTAKAAEGKWHCICGREFETKSNQYLHVQYYMSEKRISCKICSKRFLGISHLKKHMKTAHGCNLDNVDLIGCRDCGEVLNSRKDFVIHRATRHSRSAEPMLALNFGTMENAEVSRTPRILGNLLEPPSTPNVGPAPRFAVAGTSFQSWPPSRVPVLPAVREVEEEDDDDMILDAHLSAEPNPHATAHGMDLQRPGYFCRCGQDCCTLPSLNKHINYFTSQRRFLCKTCGNGFLAPSRLRVHMLRVHKIVYNISNGCKICGESFPTNMQLYQHFRTVHQAPPEPSQELRELKYTIPEDPAVEGNASPVGLDLTTSRPRAVESGKEHGALSQDFTRNADGVRVYLCTCGSSYQSRKGLLNHVRLKIRGKIYQCHLCTSRYDVHKMLRDHVAKVHKVVYDKGHYSCGMCAAAFHTSAERNAHRKGAHSPKKRGKRSGKQQDVPSNGGPNYYNHANFN